MTTDSVTLGYGAFGSLSIFSTRLLIAVLSLIAVLR
jgi:hypothetical protein